jgi:hypothetical protein
VHGRSSVENTLQEEETDVEESGESGERERHGGA